MAFDPELADRVRSSSAGRTVCDERAMFGGLAFMVGGHMACGVLGDDLVLSASRGHDRGQQRRGDEQQHGGHEQQRDDELDLRPGARGRLGGVLGGAGARGARLGGESGDERRTVAVGALERGDERGDARGRAALLELAVGRRARDAERGPRGGAAQLGGEQARVAAPDLGERARRRQAGGDGDAQQVEHVRQLALDRAAAAAGAPAEPDVGREEAGAPAPRPAA